MTIHQVGDTTAGSLGQVVGILLDNLVEVNTLDDDNLLTVRRELETLNLAISLRQLSAPATVRLHGPDFATADEGDGFVVEPCGVGLALSCGITAGC